MSQTVYKTIRYCDDLVVLCRTQAEAEAALDLIRGWTAQHGLRLHPEKTRIVDATKGGYGVTFLGYRFANGRRYVRPQGLT
jgi:retron-type reverse transcriptase